MHIILMVLKIIGIILLIILGLILLLLGVILFVPIRYNGRVTGTGDLQKLKAKICVTYLLHLVSCEVIFKEMKLKWRIRIAWIKMLGGRSFGKQTPAPEDSTATDLVDAAVSEFSPEKESYDDEDLIAILDAMDIDAADEQKHGREPEKDTEKRSDTEPEKKIGKETDTKPEKEVGKETDTASEKEIVKETDTTPEKESASDDTAVKEDTGILETVLSDRQETSEKPEPDLWYPESEELSADDERLLERADTTDAGGDSEPSYDSSEGDGEPKPSLAEKIEKFTEKITHTAEKFCVKIKELSRKKDIVVDNLTEEHHIRAVLKGKQVVWKLLKSLRPKQYELDAVYGLADPGTTGKVLAAYSVFYPFLGETVRVQADFTKSCFSGDGRVKGKLRLISFVKALLALILCKDVRITIHDIRNLDLK